MQALARAYADYGGDYRTQESSVQPGSWIELTGNHSELSTKTSIQRGEVLDFVKGAQSVELSEAAFLAVMMWGFGPTGYGPHRVLRMRDSISDGLGNYMRELIECAQRDWKEGYGFLRDNRLNKLGPSYATKLLYFTTGDENAPILDSVVAAWIKEHCKISLNANLWSIAQYSRFRAICGELLDEIADEVAENDRTLGFIEYLMFMDQTTRFVPSWMKAF